MIALQEELDWQCYRLYGLLDEDLCYHGDDLPELALGQRAFEIVMARQMANGELETTWFERHGSTPITEIPKHWPEAYRNLVERRIEVIETNKEIGLIEKPEYKRRWNTENLGRPAAACSAKLVARPAGKPSLLARSQTARATTAIGGRTGGQGQRRSRVPASRRHLPRSGRLRCGCSRG